MSSRRCCYDYYSYLVLVHSTAATIPLRVPYRGVGETRRVPAHVLHGKLDDLVVIRARVRVRVRVTVRVGVGVRVRARIRARIRVRVRVS